MHSHLKYYGIWGIKNKLYSVHTDYRRKNGTVHQMRKCIITKDIFIEYASSSVAI